MLHPSLLEIATALQVRAGLLALVVDANEASTLIARIEGREAIVNAADMRDADDTDDANDARRAGKAVAAVHQLLRDAGVFISSEMAGL